MNSLIGTLGPVGLAAVLTVVLIVGTKGDGQANALSWGWCLALSVLAGASYAAAGWPFSLVRGLVNDLIKVVNSFIPGMTLPAIGLCMLAIIAWKKLSRRGVVMMGIAFWYVAVSANGGLGILAERVAAAAHQLAS
ncbi:hypothetical protein VSR01_17335 [Actinacidiphila sp. DG2A-62]|uniref:hypothetical protein n=1 Tax=Actinacidiphila sp. DG2A-62 TaxID=3108821 RepID=UPI002DBCB2FD|nr:hypothetical protein [Actinacidiphila sp. DG2A-62]MEC3995202.1 hypothetical protein [Actinacidiphila sp. DG2A-62]